MELQLDLGFILEISDQREEVIRSYPLIKKKKRKKIIFTRNLVDDINKLYAEDI